MDYNASESGVGIYQEYYDKSPNGKIDNEEVKGKNKREIDKKIKQAIDKINDAIQDGQKLSEYKEKLEELLKDPKTRQKVSRYLEIKEINSKTLAESIEEANLLTNKEVQRWLKLKNKIEEIEKYQKELRCYYGEERDVIENIIFGTMSSAIEESKCEHETWLYVGSYHNETPLLTVIRSSKYREYVRGKNENETKNGIKVFSYNKYMCVECGMEVRTHDWERFEREHQVLKNQEYYINDEYYRRMFCMLLYQGYSIEEARNMVEEEFNNNKEKVVKKEEKMPAMKRIRRIKGRH